MKLLKDLGDYFERHIKKVGIIFLALISLYLLFYHLGYYKLIDIDETRYVGISYAMLHNGDWTTPMLNGVPFLEKPPLYFWLNVLSFKLFGFVNEFSARFMTAILALCAVWVNFFFSRRVLSVKYAIISSSILLTSFWFLLFSHVAILDFGFMFFTMCAIYSVVLTLFSMDIKYKKYFWWLGYILMALAVLMKGFIGIIIPAMVVFLTFLAFGKVKELFKPVNILPGILLLGLVAIPWHYSVYQAQEQDWVNMYIIKHHFARFLDSGMGLGRKQPFLFYVPIILCGFIPWTYSFISSLISGVKVTVREVLAVGKIGPIFSTDTNDRKLIVFSSIYFLSVLLFFSLSSTKLPSYILTVFPAISLMCAYYWWGYFEYGKYKKGITTSATCFSLTLLLAGVGALIISKFFPDLIGAQYMDMAKPFLNSMAIWVVSVGILMLLFLIKEYRKLLFGIHCIFMIGVIYFGTTFIIPLTMNFGQNELEEYANYAKTFETSRLVTFDFQTKYSVMNRFDNKVDFIHGDNFDELNGVISDAKIKKQPVFIIVKNKKFVNYKDKFTKWKTIKTGNKYTLLKH